MKFRCPYCKHVFGLNPVAICPKCKKAIKVPQDLEKSIERLKEAQAIEEASDGSGRRIVLRPFSLTSPAVPMLVIFMIIIGATFYSQWRKSPYRYSTVEFNDPETMIENAARASSDLAKKELRVLRLAFELFERNCGRYPTTQEGLMALLNNPGIPTWKGPYVLFTRPDPWKHPYQYSCTNNVLRLYSCGPDQLPDTSDDIIPGDPSPKDMADYGLTNTTSSPALSTNIPNAEIENPVKVSE